MHEWYSQTQPVEDIEAEICFLLQEDCGGHRLQLPTFPRVVQQLVRTAELEGKEESLADYYRQVLDLAQKERRPFNEVQHHFWLRLFFWKSAAFTASFPWYDSYSEMLPVLDGIMSGTPGELIYDRDQCWEINIDVHDGRLYIREWDPDYEEIHVLVTLPLSPLQTLIPALKKRTEDRIARLTQLLGTDYWTRRR
jgi:hypothetical protein